MTNYRQKGVTLHFEVLPCLKTQNEGYVEVVDVTTDPVPSVSFFKTNYLNTYLDY